ncbi:MAG: hypothetical protein Q4E57_02400 [Eubacteriales bacterium]|nr:hypothetical protein [Eubacteriales bacterium]
MKILHGPYDISGQGLYTVRGLRENGEAARLAVVSGNKCPSYADFCLDNKNTEELSRFVGHIAKEIDVFHSHGGDTFINDMSDLKLMKANGVRIFSEFHGVELRYVFNAEALPFAPADPMSKEDRAGRRERLTRLIGNSDGIILHSEGQYRYLPQELSVPVYTVPLRVDIKSLVPESDPGNPKVRIVHAPTDRRFKGTERILEELKHVKGDFELILVEGKTREEALQIYRSADIIIDQISGGSYGVFSIEAMALGKPVIAYISEFTRKHHPDLPIVSSDFENLSFVVSELISDRERRNRLGVYGRDYVERYHDHVKVTALLKKIYRGMNINHNLFKEL